MAQDLVMQVAAAEGVGGGREMEAADKKAVMMRSCMIVEE